jgi:ankyrin repeat protein
LLSCEKGQVTSVEFLLNKGSDPRMRVRGLSALHLASINGRDGVIKLLLAHKSVDVTQKSNSGLTALHYAAGNGHASAFELLLQK